MRLSEYASVWLSVAVAPLEAAKSTWMSPDSYIFEELISDGLMEFESKVDPILRELGGPWDYKIRTLLFTASYDDIISLVEPKYARGMVQENSSTQGMSFFARRGDVAAMAPDGSTTIYRIIVLGCRWPVSKEKCMADFQRFIVEYDGEEDWDPISEEDQALVRDAEGRTMSAATELEHAPGIMLSGNILLAASIRMVVQTHDEFIIYSPERMIRASWIVNAE